MRTCPPTIDTLLQYSFPPFFFQMNQTIPACFDVHPSAKDMVMWGAAPANIAVSPSGSCTATACRADWALLICHVPNHKEHCKYSRKQEIMPVFTCVLLSLTIPDRLILKVSPSGRNACCSGDGPKNQGHVITLDIAKACRHPAGTGAHTLGLPR